MPNYAQVTLIGHVGRDPEIRKTPSGDDVANFSLATTEKRSGNETTTWWRCAVWGKRANVIGQYVHKGDAIHVVGRPSMREFQGQDGQTRSSLEVFVSDFSFLGGKRDGAPRESAPAKTQPSQAGGIPFDDDADIPF